MSKKVVDKINSRISKQCTSESVINDQPRLNEISNMFDDYEKAIDEILKVIKKKVEVKGGRKSKNRRNKIVFKKRRTRRRRRKF